MKVLNFTTKQIISIFVFIFLMNPLAYCGDDYIEVVGENNPALDIPNINAAISSINENGIIHLIGTFDFDSRYLRIYKPCTIEGETNNLDQPLTELLNGTFGITSGGVTIRNLKFLDNIWGPWVWGASGPAVIIKNNIIDVDGEGIRFEAADCPIEIINNDIIGPAWANLNYSGIIGFSTYSYAGLPIPDNPLVKIIGNKITIPRIGWGMRIGHSAAGLTNCHIEGNTLQSFDGSSSAFGIEVSPYSRNITIINNDLSELTTNVAQVSIAGRNNLAQGNIFGFANGYQDYPYDMPPTTAVLLTSINFHPNWDPPTPTPEPCENNIIMNNDYRECGLPGWDYDQNGELMGGCILLESYQGEEYGHGNEVRYNFIFEIGKFPDGTGEPNEQILENPSTDQDGNQMVYDNRIIYNTAPVIYNIAPAHPIALGSGVTATVAFTDYNLDIAMIDWGDGSEINYGAIIGQTVTWNYIYSSAGVYTVTIQLVDINGTVTEETYRYNVVFDASGGFVTGGGWIDSPEGAYTADPTLTGKANFGFVSKYKKGSTVPTGNTEFQFKAGDLNFNSDLYEWLVIAGPQAKFKGDGQINNFGNYGFMVSAIDGQVNGGGGLDKFRIKIWDKDNNDAVVYDNQLNDAEDAAPMTILGGGSITIHDGKDKGARISDSGIILEGADDLEEILIYPNPVRDIVTLEFNGEFEGENLEIHLYSLTGLEMITESQVFIKQNSVEVDLTKIPAGLYLMLIENENSIFKYKLTKL